MNVCVTYRIWLGPQSSRMAWYESRDTIALRTASSSTSRSAGRRRLAGPECRGGVLPAALYNPVWSASITRPYDFALAAVTFLHGRGRASARAIGPHDRGNAPTGEKKGGITMT
jgi:hypothetical protein